MNGYTDENRKEDFTYFTQNYAELFQKYGHKFLAIKNQEVLGSYDSVTDVIQDLSDKHELGSYIIQECTGDDSAYRTTIMRLMING